MRIVVLSDSHAALSFMRRCVQKMKPNGIIHLGDYYDDGQVLVEENPNIPVHQVPGNCDRHRMPLGAAETLCYEIGGAKLFMTHGHLHNVKMTRATLLADGRRSGAAAVLYGHTHIPDCHQEADGLWVLNPGSCGYGGGSAGILEIEQGEIVACYLITMEDLR